MADITPLPFTDEQLKKWAREAIKETASHAADWGGIGEQFEDEWSGLSEVDFDRARQRVYDLIVSATITVAWDEPGGDS